MCIEDIRLQRETTASEDITSVGQTATELVGPSHLRTALVISCPNTGYITIGFTPGVTPNNGMILNALGTPLVLSLLTHGALIKKALYAVHSAGTVSVAVWEASLEAV